MLASHASSLLLLLLGAGGGAEAFFDNNNNNPFGRLLRSIHRSLHHTESHSDAVQCNGRFGTLDYLVLEDDATGLAVEDDIREDLAYLGFDLRLVKKAKDPFNAARDAGDFHMVFTESHGAPYDPHSYASGWIDNNGGEGHHLAFANFTGVNNREFLYEMIKDVLLESNHTIRKEKWLAIHNYYHQQAVMLPLWGKRIPTLMNARLSGYVSGGQQFDYPIHHLIALDGNVNITISPGAQTGLFKTVGRLDPHTYRPNEFFSNNWVYEGLVHYSNTGEVVPALATKWTRVDNNETGGDTFTFTLRPNVVFHDGEPWNCYAAQMNLDHVFAGELKESGWHGWYGVPGAIQSYECTDDLTFVIHTKHKYSTFLQDLTYIRPFRMLSPAAFANGNTSDAFEANSCHVGWKTVVSSPGNGHANVTCAGISYVAGTGPWKLESRDSVNVTVTTGDTTSVELIDNQVVFVRNQDWWGGNPPAPAIQQVTIVRYDSAADVKAALIDGSLDVVWGGGVLADRDIAEIQNDDQYEGVINVFHSADIQNVIMMLNTGKAPTNDITVRKSIIHAIHKAVIVEKELQGLQTVVDNVFPRSAPYCDVDLTPRWDYDLQKAELLSASCPEVQDDGANPPPAAASGDDDDDDDDKALALGLGLGLGFACLIFIILFLVYYNKSQAYQEELNQKLKHAAGEEESEDLPTGNEE